MKLLLTSGGFTDSIEKEFQTLLKKQPENCTVGFITTAAFGEEHESTWNASSWLEEYRNQLRQLKISDIEDIDLKDKTEDGLRKILLQKNIVFVNGGNTFYLMYWVRKSGFDKIIKEFLHKDSIYIGVSAGSIICCPTIETAGWEPADKNNVGLTDLRGLELVSFLIYPHLEKEQKNLVAQEVEKTSYPVVALTDETAVMIDDDKTKIIGTGESITFNGF